MAYLLSLQPSYQIYYGSSERTEKNTDFYLKTSENKIIADFDTQIFKLNLASFWLSLTLKMQIILHALGWF